MSAAPVGDGARRRPRRWAAPARMLTFDLAGPLLTYRILRDHGASQVTALLVAAVLPLVGVLTTAVKERHLDAIGMTVLVGTGAGALLSLLFDSPRPTLIFTGVVPGLAFGIGALISVRRTPLIYQLALSYFGGERTERGACWAQQWRDVAGFRRYFRQITVVWGIGYVLESAVKGTIIMSTSTGGSLAAVGALSIATPVLLGVWTAISARIAQRPQRHGYRAASTTAST